MNLISDRREIYGSNFLQSEENFMEGSEIEESEWEELCLTCKTFNEVWRNKISNEIWVPENNEPDLGKTMFFIRTITKYSTKLENYPLHKVISLNRSFFAIVSDFRILTTYLHYLLNNEGHRIKEVFNLRRDASDQLSILLGLNGIRQIITRDKNEFDFPIFIDNLCDIGSGLNSFLRRVIEYINPKSFVEGTKDGKWISPLDDEIYTLFKEKNKGRRKKEK